MYNCEVLFQTIIYNICLFLVQYAVRAFADALDAVPMALAENSGLQPIETLSAVKSQQIKVVQSPPLWSFFIAPVVYI